MKDGLGHNDVRALLEDRSGVLWVGTYGGGISRIPRIDPFMTNLTVETFGTSHGLSHPRAWVFHEDRVGALWIGCDRGIY